MIAPAPQAQRTDYWRRCARAQAPLTGKFGIARISRICEHAITCAFRNSITAGISALREAEIEKPRLYLGGKAGGVCKWSADEDVTTGLAIGEGLETCLSAMARPKWVALDAGGVASFSVLPGVEALIVLADNIRPASMPPWLLAADGAMPAGKCEFSRRPRLDSTSTI
jgi:hypothetical protein